MREAPELSGAIERTLRVLQCVAESGTFTAKSIADQSGLPTSTAYRLLQTLSGMNFVEKASHGGFRIGREYVRLASLVTSTCDYETMSDPALRKLADRFEETCAFALYLPTQHAFTIVHLIASVHPLQFVVEKFMPRSMAVGALGRAMLPFLSREDVEAALAYHAETPEREFLVSWDDLHGELEQVHQAGCYVGISPSALGANSTAAPVFNSRGEILGSIGITIPNIRYDPASQPHISAAVVEAARELSATLGHRDKAGS